MVYYSYVRPNFGHMTLTFKVKVIPRPSALNDCGVFRNMSEVLLGHARASLSHLVYLSFEAPKTQKCFAKYSFFIRN